MLVSIGVTAYNRPEGLRRTLECLVNQTYTNIEIIVSDNGSDLKEVSEVGAEFANRDPRVRFYQQQQNQGPNFNFKFVLAEARGEYFMWASDDDWWAPDFTAKILSKITQTPGAVAGFCNFHNVDEKGNPVSSNVNAFSHLQRLTEVKPNKRLNSFIEQFEGYGKGNLFNSIIKTEVIRSVPFDLIVEKLPSGGADLSMIFYWLMSGSLVVCEETLKHTTVGNTKHTGFDFPRFENEIIDLVVFYIYAGRLKYYWNAWSRQLLFYYKMTANSNLPVMVKLSVYLAVSKKIILFLYDLICYNVVVRGFNLFEPLKRKESLAR